MCFFAHKKSELRTPNSRPRVPPGSVSAAAMALRQQQQAQQGGAAGRPKSAQQAQQLHLPLSSLGVSPRTSLDSCFSIDSDSGALSVLAGPGGSGRISSLLFPAEQAACAATPFAAGRVEGVGGVLGGASMPFGSASLDTPGLLCSTSMAALHNSQVGCRFPGFRGPGVAPRSFFRGCSRLCRCW